MGLDIYMGDKHVYHSSYGAFTFMRQECLEQILPGLGAIHEWASFPFSMLRGIESKRDEQHREILGEYEIPCGSTKEQFSNACWILLSTYLEKTGFKNFRDLLICHSDCDGHLTAKQCERLLKDLDRITPGPRFGSFFEHFRNAVREAARCGKRLEFS